MEKQRKKENKIPTGHFQNGSSHMLGEEDRDWPALLKIKHTSSNAVSMLLFIRSLLINRWLAGHLHSLLTC